MISTKLKCKFRLVSANPKEEAPVVNLDVVHDPPKMEDLVPRAPVVAIVGHIDHGKTTLLDSLRRSNVVDTEFGGITQHIGAFSVSLNQFMQNANDAVVDNVTFLDTPGHAAFKNMRVRGAAITDIVILIVDAAEGPLEQTLESIDAVKKARVSLIVAINKIDKQQADIEGTKKALYECGVQLEDYGGDVQAVPISAINRTGLPDLIEAIVAQAEVLQLSADPKGPVEGTVIESNLDPGLGKTTTILIKRGTLRKGAFLVCGECYARVRLVLDTRAPISEEKKEIVELKSAGPAEACRVIGWKDLPHAGDEVMQVESEKRAQEVVRWRRDQRKALEELQSFEVIEQKRQQDRVKYEEHRMERLKAGVYKPVYGLHGFHTREKETSLDGEDDRKVSIVLKTDVDGSLEAIKNCFNTYKDDEVVLDIIRTGVGDVTESDMKLANEFNGIVYAFNTRIGDDLRKAASYMGVPLREHKIIYALIDDLKEEISQKLPLLDVEYQVGKGVVLKEFTVLEKRKDISVAGCRVNQGVFDKDKLFRVTRDSHVVFEGNLVSLKHLRDEVNEIPQGKECGLRIQDSNIRFDSGDVITCYEIHQESRQTDWSPGF
jgi:translation initiation factor IF-2